MSFFLSVDSFFEKTEFSSRTKFPRLIVIYLIHPETTNVKLKDGKNYQFQRQSFQHKCLLRLKIESIIICNQ